jgi:hypothetical protein
MSVYNKTVNEFCGLPLHTLAAMLKLLKNSISIITIIKPMVHAAENPSADSIVGGLCVLNILNPKKMVVASRYAVVIPVDDIFLVIEDIYSIYVLYFFVFC